MKHKPMIEFIFKQNRNTGEKMKKQQGMQQSTRKIQICLFSVFREKNQF